MGIDIFSGTKNDTEYLNVMKKDKSGSSFISKIKSNTSLYMKNPNPKKTKSGDIIKCSEYIKIDVIELANPLAEGETIELNDIYIGSKKELKSRLIITKLTEENKIKREFTHKENIRKKNIIKMIYTKIIFHLLKKIKLNKPSID